MLKDPFESTLERLSVPVNDPFVYRVTPRYVPTGVKAPVDGWQTVYAFARDLALKSTTGFASIQQARKDSKRKAWKFYCELHRIGDDVAMYL